MLYSTFVDWHMQIHNLHICNTRYHHHHHHHHITHAHSPLVELRLLQLEPQHLRGVRTGKPRVDVHHSVVGVAREHAVHLPLAVLRVDPVRLQLRLERPVVVVVVVVVVCSSGGVWWCSVWW